MLIDSPYIQRMYIKMDSRKLVVETNLPVGQNGTFAPGSPLEEIYIQLQSLAQNGFADFNDVIIQPYREEERAFTA